MFYSLHLPRFHQHGAGAELVLALCLLSTCARFHQLQEKNETEMLHRQKYKRLICIPLFGFMLLFLILSLYKMLNWKKKKI